jgi:hypothetical protein
MLYDPNWKPTEIVLEDWQKLLLEAAEILETRGWIQGEMCTDEGFCTLGAINRAGYDVGNTAPITTAILAVIAKIGAPPTMGPRAIARWNDTYGRTKEEVVHTLRDAANAV